MLLSVDANTVTQVVTLALAVLAIIWHQQRTVDKLRDDFNASDREHRTAVRELGACMTEVKERLARIEGFLGIGMPESAGPEAPGAAWAPDRPEPD